MLPRDVLGLAFAEALNRPGRSLLTTLGTVLGVALLVGTLGLTASTNAEINRSFNALVATEVDAGKDGALRTNVLARVRDLKGIEAAGLIQQLSPGTAVAKVGTAAGAAAAAAAGQVPPVMSVTPGALSVFRIHLAAGRSFTEAEQASRADVALIGSAAAAQLNLRRIPSTLYVDGRAFLVIGLISQVERHNEVLLSLLVPEAAVPGSLGRSAGANAQLIVSTRPGYADAVSASLPAAVDPVNPSAVSVVTPPDATQLRASVSGDVTALFGTLAGIGLIIGITGIASTTLVSILERVPEIGLRRALGARSSQVAMQFLLESLALGTLGGLVGDVLGVFGIAVLALANGWAPVVPLWVCFVAPLTGSLTGVIAGTYPAFRAARVDPAAALAQ